MVSPNIYHAVVFDLHPKVREFLDGLDHSGQIDQDESKAPHLISVDRLDASVHRCSFLRNGQLENVVIHTRRKADPVRSWRDDDGWVRPQRVIPVEDENGKRKERQRRTMEQVCESLMRQILPRRR